MGFYKLIESQIDPVFLIDDSGKICFTNTAFDNCFGMKAGGCAGKNISDTIPFQHPERFFAALKSIGPELPEVAFSDNLQVSVLQTELIHISLFDESTSGKDRIISGKVVLLPVAIEPTNELCCATNSLYSVEQKYKTIFNLTFEGVIIHVAGIIIEINPAFERMMGYRQDELIGVNIIDLCVLPQYRDQVISALKNVATPPYEVLAKRKDGTILHTEIESRQIILNNQVLRVTAIRDITERKLAENRLKESQERYKLLSNLTFEGIFIHDNGVLIDVNESFADLIGYERKELIGQNIIHKVILPDYQPIVYEAIKNQKISPYEVKAKRLDGSVFYAEVESRLINPKNSTLRVTAARDITSRKEAERKLQENEEELDMFFSRSADAFFIMKLDEPIYWNDHVDKEHALEMVYTKMYITKVNKAMYEHYGAKFGDLDKLTPEIFFAWDEDFGRQFTRSLLEQGTATFENHEPRADGEFMWIEGNYVVLYDDQGRVRGSCGVRRDVTLRKQAEQEIQNHNKELKKANEELDNFVYRVSHDLKAPISSAKGLIYIAKQEQHKEDIVQCLDLIGKSMNKLDSFILDILDYSRNSRSKIEATEVDLKALLSELMESTRYLQEEKNLDTKVCIGGAALFTDRRRLTFIFNNLISNAIRFSDSEKAERYLHITADITPTKATILFADNGIGIHPEHIDHIFEMFYRASETLVGSGLGLYIVKEAVEKLNGNIKVTSAPGIGTSFELTIPNFIEDESCDLQNIQHLN